MLITICWNNFSNEECKKLDLQVIHNHKKWQNEFFVLFNSTSLPVTAGSNSIANSLWLKKLTWLKWSSVQSNICSQKLITKLYSESGDWRIEVLSLRVEEGYLKECLLLGEAAVDFVMMLSMVNDGSKQIYYKYQKSIKF